MTSSLRIVPLGGLGEIGMNCMAIEADDDIVVVDCGIMFPDRDFGVDVIHPDFSWLFDRADRVRGVVLTHGHEDHIGALPYLLRELELPVYGPPYALALARERLAELRVDGDLRDTTPRAAFELGHIEIEPIRVTHSIADATALVIRTAHGTLVHSGDFKIDPTPSDGEQFDVARFEEVGREGVRLLLSDSTNADVPGTSGSEQGVADALDKIVREAPGRVVIAQFASNVHRLRAVLRAAERAGRKVCLLGRSVQNHMRIATQRGYLPDTAGRLIGADAARGQPRKSLLCIVGGTQGEAAAALPRLAAGTHGDLELEAGDTVVLSARTIPGNEQTVNSMIDDLERRGVIVRFRGTDSDVHVSGHACQDEQRRLIELCAPRGFVPIHGAYHHLSRHAELARAVGVSDTLVVENGAVVDVGAGPLEVTDTAPQGRVHVDAGEEIPSEVLRDRHLLAELGMAVVVVVLGRAGSVVGTPDVVTRGVVHEEAEPELIAGARTYVADAIAAGRSSHAWDDDEDVRELARRALKRYFARRIGRKPLTYGVVVRLPK